MFVFCIKLIYCQEWSSWTVILPPHSYSTWQDIVVSLIFILYHIIIYVLFIIFVWTENSTNHTCRSHASCSSIHSCIQFLNTFLIPGNKSHLWLACICCLSPFWVSECLVIYEYLLRSDSRFVHRCAPFQPPAGWKLMVKYCVLSEVSLNPGPSFFFFE